MPVVKTVTIQQAFNVGATGPGEALTIYKDGAAFLQGPFTGSFTLECFPPGATAWLPVLRDDSAGSAVVLTSPGTFAIYEPREGTLYRWNCTALSAGPARAGLSQG